MYHKFIIFIEKWLPIIFGCHCLPERSFYIKGKKFPICARCTGELVGIFIAIITASFMSIMPIYLLLLMLVPLILDGYIQLTTSYVSTNSRRFFTGLIFGYSLTTLFFRSTYATFKYGVQIGYYLKS